MKFVFIGGCGRSGSSLLQDLLCRHPEIAGGPEFNFTAKILQLHGNMQKPFYLKRNEEFYIQEELDSRVQEFYRSFFQRIQNEKPEANWISEKTPDNIDVSTELLHTINCLLRIIPNNHHDAQSKYDGLG